MIDIPMKSKSAIDRSTIHSLNFGRSTTAVSAPSADTAKQQIPALKNPVQKGQKVSIAPETSLPAIKACFGWNTRNSLCDVDVSAFLLGADGKVPGDEWFVFYGQTDSPDKSTIFSLAHAQDREMITVDFNKLNPCVKKIVFVLTINEAFEKNLNFGMIKDAYIRILNPSDLTEYVSFKMEDYYSNVISMMIGEVYRHNGNWKFHAVGNGVAKDLAGLCALYGVAVENN